MSRLLRLLDRPAGMQRCGLCLHFEGDPWRLEAALPGLAVLSSAHASVSGDDGLCASHGRFTSARGLCADFTLREAVESLRQPS